MSVPEILVIVVGLAVGWFIVSLFLRRTDTSNDDDKDREWFEVLQVGSNATDEEVENAYRKMREALQQRSLRIMTLEEQKAALAAQQRLDDAYRKSRTRTRAG